MTEPAPDTADPKAVRRVAVLRLATGLAQGLLIFGLDHAKDAKAWPWTQPPVFAAIMAVVIFVPFVVLAGLSTMRLSRLAAWTLVAVVIAAGLAAYAVGGGQIELRPYALLPQGVAIFAIAALLFIGHHLVQPAEMERRPIARFTTYFDETWKHGVQLALSALFTLAFWMLLQLASALFSMIGIDAIKKLIDQPWFAWPATAVMFAAAVQLTDVRAGLVRGVRTVSLTLLAWLLPLMVLIAAGFLATLPFKGLDLLWATKKAAALLLTAAAALIVLTNAAYQDGTEPPPKALAWAARIAGLLLAPITVLAAYAIWLRVNQYGFTPDRVYGAACVVVAAGYALGYAVAALKPGGWMKPLEPTNIAMAFVSVAVLLGLFTPVADPVRLSVNSQLARLEAGKVKPEAFDYDFLRFDAGQRGETALAALARHGNPAIVREAVAAQKREKRRPDPESGVYEARSLPVYPTGRALPETFLAGVEGLSLGGCETPLAECSAAVVDLDGDGVDEVLVASFGSIEIYKYDKAWTLVAHAAPRCRPYKLGELMKTGRFSLTPTAPSQDLLIGDARLAVTPEANPCDETAGADGKPSPSAPR